MINFDLDKLDACDLENILIAGNDIIITKLDDCTLEISSSGTGSASGTSYTITVPADWDGSPADVQAALDELASRTRDVEGKAESALQSGDNITELVNNAGYITDIVGENHSDLNLDDGTNPHGTTKNDVGLSNVDNTSDINKPISNATQTALDGKKDDFTENTAFNKDFGNVTGTVLEGDTRTITPSEITTISNQSGVNTGDETDASIKTKYENNSNTNAFTDAEQTNLGNQSGTNTGDEDTSSIQTKRPIKTVEGQSLEGVGNIDLDKNDVGLGNVDNTSDINKPISSATQTALDNKEDSFNKNSAFNKDFGTSSGTVLEGDTVTITPTQSSNITTNNAKVSADGSVTTHNDVTSAGSGEIITNVERANLNSQSGTNTGDETTGTIQAKRPIKTVNGQSLEGSGNVVIGVSVQPYSELTYTSGDLTLIEIYDSISKTTLLTTKDFTYTTGLLTQIVETDVATSGTKTTNLTYDVNDVLINIEKI